MPFIYKFMLLGWFCLLFAPSGMAGTIGTRKIGSNQVLVVNYTPDPDGTTSVGQLTITIATANGAAAIADRNLEIVLYVSSFSGKSIAYPVQITLPQGALTATAKLHYLQPQEYAYWVVDVFEGRRSIAQPKSNPSGMNNQQRKTWLEITPMGKTTSTLPIDFGLSGIVANTTGLSTASEDWRTYTAFDAVAIPQSLLASASPGQLQAWSTYVLAGGNLIVHSSDQSTTVELDRLMGASGNMQSPDPRWESIKNFAQLESGSKRSHGGGKLFAMTRATNDINEHIKNTTHFPMNDFAVTGDTDFRWFWRNLVQSVGTAPVWGFIVFVTLFVIVVGPLVLRLTSALRHRTLLLFLVPALSLIATLIVLFYNVVREGFGTHGRIASIQYLDENTGQGFTWSRQSYFSGAPPREGLRFPLGSLLKPVSGEITGNRRYYYDPRESVAGVIRSDGESEIISGWLLPRNQQQLLVGQRTDNARLPINISRISETTVKVTNLTDHPIPQLYFRQSIDVAYFAKDLQPGQSQELTSESASKIDATYKSIIRDFEPVEPEAIDVNNLRYYGYYNRSQSSDPIDNAIRKFTHNRLDDFGFWILLQQPPDIPLPFDKSVYSDEKHFHIMTGATKW